MILFILLLIMTGLSFILILKKEIKTSYFLTLSFLIGVGVHTVIFILLASFNIYYSKEILMSFSVILVLVTIVHTWIKRHEYKIINDFKKIPIYYVLFILFIFIRMFLITGDTLAIFSNWDELSLYQYISKQIFITHDPSYIFKFFTPMSFFIGSMTNEITGISLVNPRYFSTIFFTIIALFMYFFLKEQKVNRHISALISMIFLVSSAEVFIYYLSFYNNVYYAAFTITSVSLVLKHYFIDKKEGIPKLGFLLLFLTLFIRRESIHHVFMFIILLSIALKINRKKPIWKTIWMASIPLIISKIWNILVGINIPSTSSGGASISAIDTLISRLQPDKLVTYLKSLSKEMFGFGELTSNYLYGIVFIISIIIMIVLLIRIKKKPQNKYTTFVILGNLFVLSYLGIVVLTAFLYFTEIEFLRAASFGRYMVSVIPLCYIIIGLMLADKTNSKKEEKEILPLKIPSLPKVLLIIPAYNEEESILRVIKSIETYNKKASVKCDVIVINDGSKDNTLSILVKNKIKHIDLVHNLGIGGAVQTGYKYAYNNDYDIAIQFDGDGQHDVNYVEKLIQPIIKGNSDMVIGSRFIDKDAENFKSSWIRRIGINIISFIIKLVTGKKVHDTTSGFRASNRKIIEMFASDYPTEYPEPATTTKVLKNGYKVTEVYAKMIERTTGSSSITRKLWMPAYYMVNVILSIIVEGLGGE